MEEKDSYPFRFHQIPQIQEAEVARILDFCQVCVRGSRISLFATVPGAGSTQAVSNKLDQNDQGGENFPLLLSVLLAFCFSVAKLCPTLCNPMDCRMPGFPVLHYLPEFAQTHPTISSSVTPLLLPSIFTSIVFSKELALCIRWPKYWSIGFSISPSKEISSGCSLEGLMLKLKLQYFC